MSHASPSVASSPTDRSPASMESCTLPRSRATRQAVFSTVAAFGSGGEASPVASAGGAAASSGCAGAIASTTAVVGDSSPDGGTSWTAAASGAGGSGSEGGAAGGGVVGTSIGTASVAASRGCHLPSRAAIQLDDEPRLWRWQPGRASTRPLQHPSRIWPSALAAGPPSASP